MVVCVSPSIASKLSSSESPSDVGGAVLGGLVGGGETGVGGDLGV